MACCGEPVQPQSALIRELIQNQLQAPVVFKNLLTSWHSVPRTLDDWVVHYGDKDFIFRVAPHSYPMEGPRWEGDAEFFNTTLKNFVEWLEGKESENRNTNPLIKFSRADYWCYSSYNYMATKFQNNQDLLKAVDWGPFGFEGRCGQESTFWVGSEGAHTPCHKDTYGCNLVAQLCGRKRWTLFPPDDDNTLYPTRIPYEESSIFSSVNISKPNLQHHPKFQDSHPHVVVLEPGDVLFVPKHWWHFVECLDPAVSINTWIELDGDDETRLQESIVRTLMTAFIPLFEPDCKLWLNPAEVLESPEETLSYISAVLQKMWDSSEESEEINLPSPLKIAKKCRSNEYSRFKKEVDDEKPKLKQLKVCKNETDQALKPCINLDEFSPWIEPIQMLTYSDFKHIVAMSPEKRLERCIVKESLSAQDIVNCIVDSDVVSLMAQKLKESFRLHLC